MENKRRILCITGQSQPSTKGNYQSTFISERNYIESEPNEGEFINRTDVGFNFTTIG